MSDTKNTDVRESAEAREQGADTSSERLVEVRDLRTYFHTAAGTAKAVDGVSFTLDRGKTLAIVGESGSGKSVTASSLMRLLPKTGKIEGGTITFDGIDIVHASDAEIRELRGKDISMIFQDPMTALDPVFKVGSQMIENIRIHDGIDKKAARERAIEMLKLVNIPNPEKRLDSYPYELSGGMCQRVMIAMAMSCEPKLLIADEPTTALDVTIQAQILALMEQIRDQRNTGILLITHDLGVVAETCSRVIVMYAGNIVEEAPVEELFARPQHPYTQGLIGSVPRLGKRVRRLPAIPGSVPDLSAMPEGCHFAPRCKYARPECHTKHPELARLAENHTCACLFSKQEREEALAND